MFLSRGLLTPQGLVCERRRDQGATLFLWNRSPEAAAAPISVTIAAISIRPTSTSLYPASPRGRTLHS